MPLIKGEQIEYQPSAGESSTALGETATGVQPRLKNAPALSPSCNVAQ